MNSIKLLLFVFVVIIAASSSSVAQKQLEYSCIVDPLFSTCLAGAGISAGSGTNGGDNGTWIDRGEYVILNASVANTTVAPNMNVTTSLNITDWVLRNSSSTLRVSSGINDVMRLYPPGLSNNGVAIVGHGFTGLGRDHPTIVSSPQPYKIHTFAEDFSDTEGLTGGIEVLPSFDADMTAFGMSSFESASYSLLLADGLNFTDGSGNVNNFTSLTMQLVVVAANLVGRTTGGIAETIGYDYRLDPFLAAGSDPWGTIVGYDGGAIGTSFFPTMRGYGIRNVPTFTNVRDRWAYLGTGTHQLTTSSILAFGFTATTFSNTSMKHCGTGLATSLNRGICFTLAGLELLKIGNKGVFPLWDGGTNTSMFGNSTNRWNITADSINFTSLNGSTANVSKSIYLNQTFVENETNSMMGRATLAAGTVTVSNIRVTDASNIFLTPQASGTAQGSVWISARTAGTSFTISSTNVLDDRPVAWWIIEPT